jgi:hypothetical protein
MPTIRKIFVPPAWALLLTLVGLMPLRAQKTLHRAWTASLQSGAADTFQLTLGGMFGQGPAWQNKLTTSLSNAFRAGDSISFYGWDTLDHPTGSNNWQAGIGYKAWMFERPNQRLSLGSGLQHWRFPSVKTGTNDWLIPGNLVYQRRLFRLPFTVTGDSWSLLRSPLPTGSLVHTQAWLQHTVLKHDDIQVSFRHGPAHTYSWNFYGTHGNRVFRYQTMLSITHKNLSIEGGYRKQKGLQRGIPNNQYWQFALTRTVTLSRSK